MTDIKNGAKMTFESDLENRHRQIRKDIGIRGTMWLAFQSIGVIFGDIGTSPLYVFTGIFGSDPSNPPSADDVVGALSLIIWSLTIIPLFKYVIIILRADDNGEGGTFALYSLLSRYSGISVRGESRIDDLTITNYDAVSIHSVNREKPNFIKRSKTVQNILLTVVLLGTSLVLSDGLLTPAISVISAVEGIAIPAPVLTNAVVPISCVIIIALFLGQRFGTQKVGVFFAPVVSLWFISLASIGIWNISKNPSILKAYNPYYAINYFVRNGGDSFEVLGGVLLAVTGVEALYADLGHFNRHSIQISFPLFTYPPLILAYCGQASRLVLDPTVIENTFWNTLPDLNGPFYWTSFVLATFATIIASQAMISATFSLLYQAMQLDCFPRVKVIHTSKKVEGQIYIPEHSANLTIAYGVAVSSVMFLSTILYAIVMVIVFGLPVYLAVAFFVLFGFIDACFLSATLLKVKSGGYFTLTIAVILCFIMLLWKWGTTKRVRFELSRKTKLGDIFDEQALNNTEKDSKGPVKESSEEIEESVESKTSVLRLLETKFPVNRLPGIGLFYKEAGMGVPLSFSHFVEHFPAIPETVIFMTIRPVAVPIVGEEDRLVVQKIGNYEGIYQAIARYGYMENISQGNEFLQKLLNALCIVDPARASLLSNVDENNVITYVISQPSFIPKTRSTWRKFLVGAYGFFVNISRQVHGTWNIPVDDLIDVGMKVPL
ncbi:8870_t:CDS:10 [Acaulospora morrowiae]|uniref:8870_t:CDS:1 n=1 Tax=Acaulospora morrowiae TaxID=94023 RepID=A0A9N8YPX9_9GLOM|nr:8870_t:CDS:10 [Acaulospora morrowiae]